ncbi:hypothetical protein EYF80_011005 [Liparis tanakae]|uniref:Uncharacterized protein n=1 Tax=Liparis tanakae TaxID=230148 RepID=A0A4Z2ILV5_9TELE|nr:hypothetical protein EYF80_011005 [Liparis tanakae]
MVNEPVPSHTVMRVVFGGVSSSATSRTHVELVRYVSVYARETCRAPHVASRQRELTLAGLRWLHTPRVSATMEETAH